MYKPERHRHLSIRAWARMAAVGMLVVTLTGCAGFGSKPNTQYVTRVTVPDDALLVDCEVSPPPNKDDYMKADPSDRELMLAQHAGKQMKNLFKCNERFSKLRSWKKEVKALEVEQK